jgi:hypothetical protein
VPDINQVVAFSIEGVGHVFCSSVISHISVRYIFKLGFAEWKFALSSKIQLVS